MNREKIALFIGVDYCVSKDFHNVMQLFISHQIGVTPVSIHCPFEKDPEVEN